MSCIAKVTNTACQCGYKGSLCFTERENWKRECPDCGRLIEPGAQGPQRYYGDRRFSGSESESITEGFHPGEVKIARKAMPKSADCIKDDGRVFFESRSQQKTFVRELEQARQQTGAQRDAVGMREYLKNRR